MYWKGAGEGRIPKKACARDDISMSTIQWALGRPLFEDIERTSGAGRGCPPVAGGERTGPTNTRLMRIHQHVSLLQFVAIVGAIALAAMVGLLMSLIESATQDLMATTAQHHRLVDLQTEAADLDNVIATLDGESAAKALLTVGRSIERWLVDLIEMRRASDHISATTFDTATQPLQRMIQICPDITGGRTSGREFTDAIAQLQTDSTRYVRNVDQLQEIAASAVKATSTSLTRRRRIGMMVIGVLCLLYLAMIEHMRYWTTRQLVRPVEELADAAIQAMRGEESLPQLEECGTQELNALARMLSSFVETLKQKVHERTAELERQKVTLEREVAVRRRAEEQLRHAAFHDRLTSLCNRDLLMDRLDRCITRARRNADYKFAVLFLDVDRFKEVNDSLGHTVGDELLVEIARRIQTCLRDTDTLSRVESNTISRIGGDEFVILLDGIKARTDASLVAERLQSELAAPFSLSGHEIFSSASIGIAFNELEYDTPDHLLRDADAAMYHAKASGKARHEVFNKQMHAEAVARLQLGTELRRAIENNELVVQYQPIINLRTGRIGGFEALVRWNHPKRGMISPLDFIGRAEETGLVVQLGEQVLRRACSQIRAWHDEFPREDPLAISVNVSKRQVAEPGLVKTVKEILQSVGVDGRYLKLEITESVIMANPDSITEVLRQLRELGVQIHMDDFGTGYSSLSYLHRFPIDVLKIDREFVSTMGSTKGYAGVVQTVVVLAHNLHMEVIVEGVETREQLAQLIALDCDHAQGFYFAEALDPDKATELLMSSPHWIHASAA